jgi:hypothetical protein
VCVKIITELKKRPGPNKDVLDITFNNMQGWKIYGIKQDTFIIV